MSLHVLNSLNRYTSGFLFSLNVVIIWLRFLTIGID